MAGQRHAGGASGALQQGVEACREWVGRGGGLGWCGLGYVLLACRKHKRSPQFTSN